MSSIKIGHGYDVHAFTRGSGFMLGGIEICSDKAIVAHSDGDVLIHALCDAMLGALGRGDIGQLFPDSDASNRNRDSREFLREVKRLADEDGFGLGNADITVILQAPKLGSRMPEMKRVLAQDLACRPEAINIKATTTEKLGFIGREEGIAVEAVVVMEATA
jgi:2-C-methyl-D-erythritol 2,4-cyclodiphosphate synthase